MVCDVCDMGWTLMWDVKERIRSCQSIGCICMTVRGPWTKTYGGGPNILGGFLTVVPTCKQQHNQDDDSYWLDHHVVSTQQELWGYWSRYMGFQFHKFHISNIVAWLRAWRWRSHRQLPRKLLKNFECRFRMRLKNYRTPYVPIYNSFNFFTKFDQLVLFPFNHK